MVASMICYDAPICVAAVNLKIYKVSFSMIKKSLKYIVADDSDESLHCKNFVGSLAY